MLSSLAYLFIISLFFAYIFRKIGLPTLIGMLITGMLLGPYGINILDKSILNISSELRQIALIIILFRVGLALDVKDLKEIGRPAIFMSWVPATFEIIGIVILAPVFLKVSYLEAAIIGAVIAAVSPAVIVPRMLNLMHDYGKGHKVPQLLMASASVDDIYVIILFSSFVAMQLGDNSIVHGFFSIGSSVISGIVIGLIVGYLLVKWFKKFTMRDSVKVIIMLAVAFLLLHLEHSNLFPFSGLLAVICSGIVMLKLNKDVAERVSMKFGKLWVAAEVLLFVLVGATVNIKYAINAGLSIIILIVLALLFRMGGVWISLLGSKLNGRERFFCMLSYMPKATVQAAIGGVPLAMGLGCGEVVLAVAVISILLTAPLGAIAIDCSYKKLLSRE